MIKRIIIFTWFLLLSTTALAGHNYGAGKRVLPHFPSSSGGFIGVLVANNPSNLKKKVTLTCYTVDGKTLAYINLEVEPKQLMRFPVSDFLPAGTSHALISGSERVSFSVAFESSEGSDARSSAKEVVSQNGEVKIIPSFKEDSSSYWDGAAVVNMGDSQGVVMVEIMADGILGPPGISIPIAPMEKKVFTFTSLFGGARDIEGSYFKVSSDQPFAFMGLAGTTDHRILWPVIPNPVENHKGNSFSDDSVTDLQVEKYTIDELSISEELLTVVVGYTERCTGELKLFMSGGFMESYPVQANLVFQRINDPNLGCLDVLTVEEETFDLSPLVQDYIDSYGQDDVILLNIYDYNGDRIRQLEYSPGR